jgi:hypothetical protein
MENNFKLYYEQNNKIEFDIIYNFNEITIDYENDTIQLIKNLIKNKLKLSLNNDSIKIFEIDKKYIPKIIPKNNYNIKKDNDIIKQNYNYLYKIEYIQLPVYSCINIKTGINNTENILYNSASKTYGYTFSNNEYYEGELLDDMRHGKGKLIFFNTADFYEGDFYYDNITGKGIYKFVETGIIYDGMFLDNKLHGKGTLLKVNNIIIYDGEFQNGFYHGNGILHCEDDAIFEGEFEYGELINGVKKYIDGTIYQGKFQNGQFMEGYGKDYDIDGSYIEGKCYNGKLINGKKVFTDGIIYEGEFNDGELIQGKKIFPKKYNTLEIILEGEFKNNILINGKYIIDSNIVYTVSNSKLII